MHIDSEIKVSLPYHCQFSQDRDQFISNGFMCTFFDCDRRSYMYVFIVHYKYIYILYNLPVAP